MPTPEKLKAPFCIIKESLLSIFATMELFIKLHQDQVSYNYKNHWPASKLE